MVLVFEEPGQGGGVLVGEDDGGGELSWLTKPRLGEKKGADGKGGLSDDGNSRMPAKAQTSPRQPAPLLGEVL